MGILFRRPPVRGPARVADAVGPVNRIEADHFLEVAQFARSPPDIEHGIAVDTFDNGNAGRVVATIF